jgi:hypothetical protein
MRRLVGGLMTRETYILIAVLLYALTAIYQLVCASVSATIASRKNHNRVVFFFLSLLMLGALGVAVAVLVPPAEAEASQP